MMCLRVCTVFLLLWCPSALARVHRFTFDGNAEPAFAFRASSDTGSGLPLLARKAGTVELHRERGLRTRGGYLGLRGRSHLVVASPDEMQFGTEFSVAAWVRPKTVGERGGTLFSMGTPSSDTRCTAWTALRSGGVEDEWKNVMAVATSQHSANACKLRCAEQGDAPCKGIVYDSEAKVCKLLRCNLGTDGCKVTNDTEVVSAVCAAESMDMSFFFTRGGFLGFTWRGESCYLKTRPIGNHDWYLVSVSVSTDASVYRQGLVRLLVHSPWVGEVACQSSAWFSTKGVAPRSREQTLIGADVAHASPPLEAYLDDVTFAAAGASEGSLIKQIATDLAVLSYHSLDGPQLGILRPCHLLSLLPEVGNG
ncbi:hypothetical protein DIPPA_27884 [Diplonema papillatum]|nr:hypothetical protein DIPPA_27884 [Diplonema papillatum]